MLRIIAVIGFFFFSASGLAFANDAPLTEDQARKFAQSLEPVNELGREMEAEGKTGEVQFDTRPKAGEKFRPYSKAVESLQKNYPAELNRLEKAVRPFGFSAPEWARIGDRVIVAYLALEMDDEDPRTAEMMAEMDQSMLDMMPPEMRPQLEAAFAMMETVRNAPEADKQVVAKVKPELDAVLDRPAAQ